MTKVKALDRSLYPSISDAIYEIMDKHLLVAADNPIYGGKALSEVLFFLCENNILHQYTTIPAPAGAECDEIISLVWMEEKTYGNEVWYSRGKTGKNNYRVTLAVEAEALYKVEDWVATLTYNNDEIDVTDWSVEEV